MIFDSEEQKKVVLELVTAAPIQMLAGELVEDQVLQMQDVIRAAQTGEIVPSEDPRESEVQDQ